jgi:hypothetical protein
MSWTKRDTPLCPNMSWTKRDTPLCPMIPVNKKPRAENQAGLESLMNER